jgi:hypothetical protein
MGPSCGANWDADGAAREEWQPERPPDLGVVGKASDCQTQWTDTESELRSKRLPNAFLLGFSGSRER